MTIHVHPDLRGFAGHVREPTGKRRLVHITDSCPTEAEAHALATAWASGFGEELHEGGKFGWEDAPWVTL